MQWGKNDNAANSVNWGVAAFRKTPDSTNTALLFGNTTAGIIQSGAAVGQFGVSAGELKATRANTDGVSRPAHSGWVIRKEGTGGRAGRVTYEVLVPMKGITGDGEDAVFPDYTVVISTQPSDSSLGTGNAISFSVVAASVPTGATLSYQWQIDGGVGTWANLSNGGLYANTTEATLNIANNATLSGNVVRVLVTAPQAANAISQNATITVV